MYGQKIIDIARRSLSFGINTWRHNIEKDHLDEGENYLHGVYDFKTGGHDPSSADNQSILNHVFSFEAQTTLFNSCHASKNKPILLHDGSKISWGVKSGYE